MEHPIHGGVVSFLVLPGSRHMESSRSSPTSVYVQSLDQMAPIDIAWLWAGRLALGKLAVFDGDPGLGKSLLTLDLCGRLSTCRPFPDGTAGPGPANCLVLSGEDTPCDVIRPRVQALGGCPGRVFV